MSDERDKLDGELSEAASREHLWKSFLESAGWIEFERMFREQCNVRMQVVCMTPLGNEFAVYAQEFFKGEFSGMMQMLEKPRTMLEQAKAEVVLTNAKLENEDEAEDRVAARGRSRVDTDEHFGQ